MNDRGRDQSTDTTIPATMSAIPRSPMRKRRSVSRLFTAGSTPWWAAPGAVVLLVASVSFLDSHIFWPRGVFTMIGVALGMSWLSLADEFARKGSVTARRGRLGDLSR